MTPVRHRLRAGFGLLAAIGVVLGGGAVATADTPDVLDPVDAHLSDLIVDPWVYAFEHVQPAVDVSGTEPARDDPDQRPATDVFDTAPAWRRTG